MRAFIATAFGLFVAMGASAQVRYYYDELNRLVEVVATDGASVQYAYDAAGNITLVRRSAAAALSLTEFTPNVGPVGTAVTLYGSGFSATLASNTVRFNGVAATVTAATATTLNVTVPSGATTGLITVTTAAGSVSSSTSFVVGVALPAPTITGITPQIGPIGTVVTVSGTNFQATAVDNKVAFGAMAAALAPDAGNPSATQLKASVPGATASGKISVTTPYGKATSTADFFALPVEVAASEVEFKGRLTVDGSALTVTTTAPGKKAVLVFDGQVGQVLHLLAQSNSFVDGIAVNVYNASGARVEALSLYGPPVADFTKRLSASGTYTVVIAPISTAFGTLTLKLVSDVVGSLAVDGTTAVSLSPGRNGRYSFTAEANKGYGLALTGLAFTPTPTSGYLYVTLRKLDGTSLASCAFTSSTSCDLDPSNFTTTGSYYIDFDPSEAYAAAFIVVLSKDTGSALTVDAASATTVTIARAGQNGRYTFNGVAGQNINVVLTGNTLDDGDAATDNYTSVNIFAPSSTTNPIGWGGIYSTMAGAVVDAALPESGIYTVVVNPSVLDKGTLGLQVKSYLTGALTVDGTTAINLSSGRNARYSFTAEANKGYGLALTGLAFTPTTISGYLYATLRRLDGTPLAWCNFNVSNSCDFDPVNFTAAGSYYIDFDPSELYAASFSAVLSKDTGSALTVDASTVTAVTIARAGQNGRYTFTGVAGQNISVVLTGNTLDDGDAATDNYTYVYLYAPSNAASPVGWSGIFSTMAGAVLDVTLPESGTYTLLIGPTGLDRGAVGLQVKSYLTGALTVDGTTAINLSSGRNARYSFAAEANKGYGLALTGLAFTPTTTNGYLYATLRKLDGTPLAWCNFNVSNSCDFDPSNFTAAGNYYIDFDPSELYAASFNAVLSKDTGGALTVDAAVATTVNIARAGQNGRYTFGGTAGQSVSLLLNGNTLNDGDSATDNHTSLHVYAPSNAVSPMSGAGIFSSMTGTTSDLTLPESGTYTVVVNPTGLDIGTVGLQIKSYLTGTLTVDGITSINLTVGRNARYSFTAQAGQGYGLAAAGLVFTPVTTSGYLNAALRSADGTAVAWCSFNASSSCDFAPSNFPVAGSYYIDFDPSELYAAAFSAVLSKDTGSALTVDAATATTVTLARAGQNGRYTFVGAAGQNISLLLTGNTLSDGDTATDNYTSVNVYAPSNSTSPIGWTGLSSSMTAAVADMALTESGSYTIFVNPTGLDKGTVGLQIKSYLTGALTVDGTTAINLSAGRNARYSFTAEVGKGYGLAVTNLVFTPATTTSYLSATLRSPDGAYLASCSFTGSSSCDFDPSYFTAAGSYYIDFDPSELYAAAFNAVLSKDAGGALTVDAATAVTVNIARAGQNGRYTFSGTVGQSVSLVLSGNTLNDGDAATNNYTPVNVYAPSNATSPIGWGGIYSTMTGAVLDVVLPESGTYTAFVNPVWLDKGTVGLQVKSYLTGALTVDGTTAINLTAGRNARYGFTAEAGKGYGLAITGLVFTPATTSGYLTVTLRSADGTYLMSCNFNVSNSCDFDPSNFATAGSYYIDFDPSELYAASFNAVLSKDTVGVLTLDAATATTVTIARAGQNGRYTFSGTAGQNISLLLTGNTLNDGDVATDNYTYVYLYAPSNLVSPTNGVAFASSTAGATLDTTLIESGTYGISILPAALDRGTVGIRVIRR